MKAPKNPKATIGRRVRYPVRRLGDCLCSIGKITYVNGPRPHAAGSDRCCYINNTICCSWRELEPYGPEWDEDVQYRSAGLKERLERYQREVEESIIDELQESHEDGGSPHSLHIQHSEKRCRYACKHAANIGHGRVDTTKPFMFYDPPRTWRACDPTTNELASSEDSRAVKRWLDNRAATARLLYGSHEGYVEWDRKMRRKFHAMYDEILTNNNERKDEMNHVAQAILDKNENLTKDQATVVDAFRGTNPFNIPEFNEWFFLKFIDDKDLIASAHRCLARREEEAKR